MYKLDDIELTHISGGTFRLDGGAMFGVVPKPLWEKRAPSDERNRILLNTNCVLVRTAGKLALIDTGYGPNLSDKERQIHDAQAGPVLLQNLAKLGVEPNDIHAVIFSHLHFDHAGGSAIGDGSGSLRPAFPRAKFFMQRAEWEDATSDVPELEGQYLARDFTPFGASGQAEPVDGDVEIMPGIRVRKTGGHTRGHQAIIIGNGAIRAVYTGDICPTFGHLKNMWSMAYDQNSREVHRIKPLVLSEIAEKGWIQLSDHDPNHPAARLREDAKLGLVVAEPIAL